MQKKSTVTDRDCVEAATRFLAIKSTLVRGNRANTASHGRTRVSGSGDRQKISYEFSPIEVRTLQVIHEVTGTSMEWLAGDAIGWTREYISDLTDNSSGQLLDLIDLSDGGVCPVAPSHRLRTRLFLERVESAWSAQRQRESEILKEVACKR